MEGILLVWVQVNFIQPEKIQNELNFVSKDLLYVFY